MLIDLLWSEKKLSAYSSSINVTIIDYAMYQTLAVDLWITSLRW